MFVVMVVMVVAMLGLVMMVCLCYGGGDSGVYGDYGIGGDD